MQVALLSGLDADAQKKLNSSKDSNHHLNKLLRILTVRTESGRERSGIALVGGPHDPKADGSATQRYPPEPCLVLCKSHSVSLQCRVHPPCGHMLSRLLSQSDMAHGRYCDD